MLLSRIPTYSKSRSFHCPDLQQSYGFMQVELKYPPASDRPAQAAGQAQPLSFRPGELPKQAAKLPQWAPDQVTPPVAGFPITEDCCIFQDYCKEKEHR